ncbi:hypothetical protein [Nocardiopsis sp. CC223A]|uniref:hypothetical protein n=1 Tax=Nocardiopsis sp. CC223A TaxID=3044051 RepID=UPI00278BEBC1|nr:hypothetical protein [Nocardiopsis sp. CC223A]
MQEHETENLPPVVDLRPDADAQQHYNIVLYLGRIAAVLRRIAYDVDELGRARTVQELEGAAVAGDRRAERGLRLGEPEPTFAEFHRRVRAGETSSRYLAWRGAAPAHERGRAGAGLPARAG